MMLYLREAWRSLYATKQRTLLALVGIVIGIGSVIALVSIGNVVAAEATRQFRALGTDIVVIGLVAPDQGDPRLRAPALAEGVANHTRCVEVAAPFVREPIDLPESQQANSNVPSDLYEFGVTEDFQGVGRLSVRAGRFVSDLDGGAPFVVLGAGMPALLGLSPDPAADLGREVVINNQALRVAGVLKHSANLRLINTEPDHAVFMPIGAMVKSDQRLSIDQVLGRMRTTSDPGECVKAIRRYFEIRAPDIQARATTAQDLIAQMRKQADLLGVLLAAIGSISLVVGGVGIMNIMLVSVSERKQEIGIRRALGAKRRDVRYQFLTESLLLSLVGGAIGIAGSIGVTWATCQFNQWTFFITPGPIVLGAGISMTIGVLFGFLPAHQAAGLDPIQSLQAQ